MKAHYKKYKEQGAAGNAFVACPWRRSIFNGRRILLNLLAFAGVAILFLAGPGNSYLWAVDADEIIVIEKKSIFRNFDPIEVTGQIFPRMLQKKISNLRLFAIHEEKILYIPFQIDERTPDEKFILPHGPKGNSRFSNGLLDRQDLLAFMVSDLGDRIDVISSVLPADYVAEIEVEDPLNGGKAWCYLAYFIDIVPDVEISSNVEFYRKPQITCRGQSYQIECMVNRREGRAYTVPIIKSLTIPKAAGGEGKNIVDQMKIRGKFRLMFRLINLDFNEGDIIGGVEAYSIGPIRFLVRSWISIEFPMNIPAPMMYVDLYGYDTLITVPVHVDFPSNPKLLRTGLQLNYGYDLNPNAKGMEFYSSNNPDGFTVNGIPEPDEENMNHRIDKWRCLTGPQGSIITRTDWDPEYLREAEAGVYYVDDLKKSLPPESHRGAIGYQYNISSTKRLRSRAYDFQMDWYFPPFFSYSEYLHSKEIKQFLNIKTNPLRIKVGDLEEENRAGRPLNLIIN